MNIARPHTDAAGPTIADVEFFWNAHPLCAFELPYPVGSREFFDWHHQVRHADEGQFAGHLYEFDRHKGEWVLDVGCGIGWLVWQFARGGANVTGIDLSDNSLALARRRLDYDGLQAELVKGNAQELPFPDGSFDFVTSAGVLHHTPDTQKAINEVYRVLRPGGRAMISLYYRNWALSRWMWPFTRMGVHLAFGRVPGRSQFASVKSVEDFARLYDGNDNPIGRIYTTREFKVLFSKFNIDRVEVHYFPQRFLPSGSRMGAMLRSMVDRWIGLMIYAALSKGAPK